MLAAMCEACGELGLAGVSVTDVVVRAGVSRRTFYEMFSDREQCLLAAVEEGLQRVGARVVPAYHGQSEWRKAIRAGLHALLEFIADDPVYARLLIVDTPAAGEDVLARRAEAVDALVGAVHGGHRLARSGRSVPESAAEGVVGGALAILRSRLSRGGEGLAPGLGGELMALILAPYLGAAAAAREVERFAHARPTRSSGNGHPLSGAHIRLTYRTVRVLHALADRPGASNRQAAELAGIGDPGQTSKLLARLAARGLIENSGTRYARGGPNAWRLTGEGAQLQEGIAAQRIGW
jgi:AcrR family transcriptional regulator/DNA-binding MarR family transcriptional regulator